MPGLTQDEIVIEVDVATLAVRTEPRPDEAEAGRRYLQREQVNEPIPAPKIVVLEEP